MDPRPIPKQELERRIFELEEQIGISKGDDPVYANLTQLQYLFVLEWTNPDEVPTNLVKWSEEKQIRRRDIYAWQNHPKVSKAIRKLTSTKNRTRAVELTDTLFKKAKDGDTKSIDLFFKFFPPVDPMGEENTEGVLEWDTSLGTTTKKANPPKSKSNPDTSLTPQEQPRPN